MFENCVPGFRRQPITYDYNNLRIAATQGKVCIKYLKCILYVNSCFIVSQSKPNRSEIRVPTSVWSGYGFSQSSPSAVLKGHREVNSF